MTKDILIHVKLSAADFRAFCCFDTFRRQRKWFFPVILSALLFTYVTADLLFLHRHSDTIAGLLTGLAIAVPMVYFGLYLIQIEAQVMSQNLREKPEVYTIRLQDRGVHISGAHRSGGWADLSWDQLFAAYRRKKAVYLYASPGRAFILPDGQSDVSGPEIWEYLVSKMGNGKCFKV